MKKRTTYSPFAELIVPARPEGMAPMMRIPAMTLRGPYPVRCSLLVWCDVQERYVQSTSGPTMTRTRRVEHSEMMLELPVLC